MAINLNDRASVTEFDPKGMYGLIEAFPEQCREALAIAQGVEPPALENLPGLVVIAGMGGSAAGGDFVRALFDDRGAAAVLVNRDYTLPNYVGLGDLVFCCSYSGDTEETLSVYEVAKSSGAKIVCVTSGGKLKERAEADGHVVYVVPGGLSPRAALGYMLIPVVHACQSLKLIPEQDFEAAFAALGRCREALRVEESDNPAKAIAQHLAGSLTLVYGLAGYKGLIANRWRSQLNENAKHLAFANSYPELDHNEIVGWIGAEKQSVGRFAGVLLEDGSETEKMRRRVEVTERLLEGKCRFHHVRAEGESLLERMLWLTYFGDWVSIYLARLNEQDPVDIAPIDTLKEQLAKVG